MLDNLFKRCSHEYKLVGEIAATAIHDYRTYEVPCYFLECKHCGKRIVLREPDYNYSDSFLSMLDLWERRQYKINFKDYEVPSYKSECPPEVEQYEIALREIQNEVRRFNLPIYDSENRLIVNNIKELVSNALQEGSTGEGEE